MKRTSLLGLALVSSLSLIACSGCVYQAPTVFAIGDSIDQGYLPTVRDDLGAGAKVERKPYNTAGDTGHGLEEMHGWLDGKYYDVIIYNFGLWDMAYWKGHAGQYYNCSVAKGEIETDTVTYERRLELIADYLAKHAGSVVWIDTTPIPLADTCHVPRDEEIYNAIGERVAREHGFRILKLESRDQHINDVHYFPDGYVFLGHQVSQCIGAALHGTPDNCPAEGQ